MRRSSSAFKSRRMTHKTNVLREGFQRWVGELTYMNSYTDYVILVDDDHNATTISVEDFFDGGFLVELFLLDDFFAAFFVAMEFPPIR